MSVHFRCNGCGGCCVVGRTPPNLTMSEAVAFAGSMLLEVELKPVPFDPLAVGQMVERTIARCGLPYSPAELLGPTRERLDSFGVDRWLGGRHVLVTGGVQIVPHIDGTCPGLVDGRCAHYPNWPFDCAAFPLSIDALDVVQPHAIRHWLAEFPCDQDESVPAIVAADGSIRHIVGLEQCDAQRAARRRLVADIIGFPGVEATLAGVVPSGKAIMLSLLPVLLAALRAGLLDKAGVVAAIDRQKALAQARVDAAIRAKAAGQKEHTARLRQMVQQYGAWLAAPVWG